MKREAWKKLLDAVILEAANNARRYAKFQEVWEKPENAPGHAHQIIGIWDSDNGILAGQPCSWCIAWNAAREALAEGHATQA